MQYSQLSARAWCDAGSHECVAEGFAWPFDSREVMTLFSASNYAGRSKNKARAHIR